MADGYQRVQNWQSFENQGGGIALADLGGAGPGRDLFVLRVDNPVGKNQGFYTVGKGLDATGNVTGGWSNWIEIPGWFPWENSGAGIAVFKPAGTARPNLYIFMVDNTGLFAANRGVYRIGRTLDTSGVVTGGWTDWIDVPDWFSFINQGATMTVADIEARGRTDLIVYMIDAPINAPNRALYRIGRDVDANGVVNGGWTQWIDMDVWIFGRVLGLGVAATNSATAGRSDLLFFHVEDAPTLTQGFYKVAHAIDETGGVPRERWSPWYGAPGWFSWDVQGAGIAIAPGVAPAGRDIIFFDIDAAVDLNAGAFRVFPFDEDPREAGKWDLLPYLSDVLPVHAASLPKDGKVLFFAGSGNSVVRFDAHDFGDPNKIPCSVVWTPNSAAAPHFGHPATIFDANHRPIDLFCCGHCFMGDGKLIAAGGTKLYDVNEQDQSVGHGFFGRRDALVFDFQDEQWTPVTPMAGGRWYPTMICLGDGRILVTSGLDENGGLNGSLEIYDPAADFWRTLHYPNVNADAMPNYAHLFVLRDGRIFYTGGRMDDDQRNASPRVMNITTEPIGFVPIDGLADADSRNQSASVILGPAQAQQFLIIGGATANNEDNATGSVSKIDLSNVAAGPRYEDKSPLLLPRIHLNATLLPDRTVFVSGGALQREGGAKDEARKVTARFQSEIYDPATDTWKLAATASVERMYHSVACLMPDGRVFSASGNPDKGHSATYSPPDVNEELRLEIYSPPYLFRGARPVITSAPPSAAYGGDIKVGTPQAAAIASACLIRAGSTTHSFNSDQRLVDLPISGRTAAKLTLTLTAERNVAPPGPYMLFIVDGNGVPSEAKWVFVQ